MPTNHFETATRRHPMLIAELCQNHEGDIDVGLRMLDAIRRAGGEYVKFQYWDKKSLFHSSYYRNNRKLDASPAVKRLKVGSYEGVLDKIGFRDDFYSGLYRHARRNGLKVISTPTSKAFVDLIVKQGMDIIKIASGDLNNLDLIRYAAQTGKPILIATGMGTYDEMRQAVECVRATGNPHLALLYCVACYPARIEDINLENMAIMRQLFGVPVGYSDHTIGITAPMAAMALGAPIIEKHFSLDNTRSYGDHLCSANEEQWRLLVQAARELPRMGQCPPGTLPEAESAMIGKLRRSAVYARDLKAGAVVRPRNIVLKRPGTGVPPGELRHVHGRTLRRAVKAGTLAAYTDFV